MSVVTLKMQGANVPRSTIEALLRELDPPPSKKIIRDSCDTEFLGEI